MTRRTPQPGDTYWKHGREFCRVLGLNSYNLLCVCFHGCPGGRSFYPLAEFHALIERETWGRA